MAAYTFLWAGKTWDDRASDRGQSDFPYIDYVAGDNKRPLSQVRDGDEIFVVSIKGGRLRVGGRLVVDGGPVTEAAAAARLPRNRLIGKDLYVFGKKELLNRFRPNFYLEQDEAFALELTDTAGDRKVLETEPVGSVESGIYRQELRQPYLLSDASATLLRRRLGISVADPTEAIGTELLEDLRDLESIPDKTEREALAKARIGQGRFRIDVQRRWGLGEVCALTGFAVAETLIASHIKPWRNCSNAERLDPMNRLLLAAHVDKLFDRYLLSFREERGDLVSVLHPRVRVGCSKAGIKDGLRLNTSQLGSADTGRLKRYMAGHLERFAQGSGVALERGRFGAAPEEGSSRRDPNGRHKSTTC